MTNVKLTIQPIEGHQLEETANCHMSAFPDSFATKLGINYVKKMLEWYIVSKDRFLTGVIFGDKIVGYVGGAKGSGSTSAMMQYAYWDGIVSLVVRPYLLFNSTFLSQIGLISRNIRMRVFQRRQNIELSATKISRNASDLSIGLVVIGVHSEFRRRGVGSMLLKAFTEKSLEIGGTHGHLSVKTSNSNAIKAYKKNGWEIASSNNKSTVMKIKVI